MQWMFIVCLILSGGNIPTFYFFTMSSCHRCSLTAFSEFTFTVQSSYIYHFFSFLILFQFFEAFISFVLILKFHVILLSGFIFIIFFTQFYRQLLCIRIIVNHASTVHSLFKNKYAINVQWVYFYIISACLGG